MLKDNISSWTWHALEGTKTTVDVYASSDRVELFLNDSSLGVRDVDPATFTASFEVEYQPGILKAVGYTGDAIDGEYILKTASKSTHPTVDFYNEGALSFATISFTDENGICNQQEEHEVSITVHGGKLLGFGSANPSSEGNYYDTVATTFDGKLLVVIETEEKQTAKMELVVDGESKSVIKFERSFYEAEIL
jgi:hypothetical protein